MKKIWPPINRFLTMVIYIIVTTVKNGVKIALEQMKGKG